MKGPTVWRLPGLHSLISTTSVQGKKLPVQSPTEAPLVPQLQWKSALCGTWLVKDIPAVVEDVGKDIKSRWSQSSSSNHGHLTIYVTVMKNCILSENMAKLELGLMDCSDCCKNPSTFQIQINPTANTPWASSVRNQTLEHIVYLLTNAIFPLVILKLTWCQTNKENYRFCTFLDTFLLISSVTTVLSNE